MQLDPQVFPDLPTLRHRAMALAMLDAILCPDYEYRYFSFDPAWRKSEQLACMRNGEGDDWYLHLGEHGAAIKGYVHELASDGARTLALEVQRRMPESFSSFVYEPAFSMDAVSYCYWRGAQDKSWNKVRHPNAALANRADGSADYLSILLAPATCYHEYASDYFEAEAPLPSIEHIYHHAPLTEAVVRSLNPQLSMDDAQRLAAEIGYPCMAA